MSTVDVDSRGRIYIPKEMREDFGDKFKIVKLKSGIKLIPISDDPVEGLKEALKGAKSLDIEDISSEAEQKAKEELREEF